MIAKDKYLKQIGLKIKEIRLSKNLSQTDLAFLLDKDQQSIQRIEKGRVNISIYLLLQICDALEIKMEDFHKKLN